MRVLVTNDDGVGSPGLAALAAGLAADGHDVTVVAPLDERSGSGSAIGAILPGETVQAERVAIPGLDDMVCWGVGGTPALCVILALRLQAFGPAPEVVASGINPGFNTGRSVFHSGTVGAALTAANAGVSAVAVSMGMPRGAHEAMGFPPGNETGVVRDPTDGDFHWPTAVTLACRAVRWAAASDDLVTLNVNVPNVPSDALAGVREAPLARFGAATTRLVGPPGEGPLTLHLGPPPLAPDPGTDTALVAEGWATVTAIVGVREAQSNGAASALAEARATTG